MYTVYELSIFLDDITPLVWRRFRIPADATIDDLHQVIQVVMGWDDVQDHRFSTGGMRYASTRRGQGRSGQVIAHEAQSRVGEVLVKPKQRMIYTYGNETSASIFAWRLQGTRAGAAATTARTWRHTITLVSMHESLSPIPRCVDGARACPPEESGGAAGYAQFLARSRGFAAEAFSSHEINRRLTRNWTPCHGHGSDAEPMPTSFAFSRPSAGSAAALSYLNRWMPSR